MKQTKITMNLQGLKDLHTALAKTFRARVGVLGSDVARKHDPKGMTNSEIGLLQMFGSITLHIPPRDFLIFPIKLKGPEIIKQMNASNQVKEAFKKRDYRKIFKLLGAVCEIFVQQAFETAGFGQWPPNAPRTIAIKGSSKPLIDTGELRKAISSDVVKAGKA